MVSASPPCAAPNSTSAFVAPKTENLVPGRGLCRFRRTSTLRSTRQDAQMNYLSTLSIFMKQTTYLATLPNPKASRPKPLHILGVDLKRFHDRSLELLLLHEGVAYVSGRCRGGEDRFVID